MRGPATSPRSIAFLSAMSTYSSAPTLRIVVKPASSVRHAYTCDMTALSIGLRLKRST